MYGFPPLLEIKYFHEKQVSLNMKNVFIESKQVLSAVMEESKKTLYIILNIWLCKLNKYYL